MNHPDVSALSTPAVERQISLASLALIGTLQILTTEMFNGMHRFSPKHKVFRKSRLAHVSVYRQNAPTNVVL
jgi:hypothetical protein